MVHRLNEKIPLKTVIQSNSVITKARDRTFLFVITRVRYNWVHLCTKITNLTSKSIHYNQVFVNNHCRLDREGGPQGTITVAFSLHFYLNVAREARTNAQCGPRTKIVAYSCVYRKTTTVNYLLCRRS